MECFADMCIPVKPSSLDSVSAVRARLVLSCLVSPFFALSIASIAGPTVHSHALASFHFPTSKKFSSGESVVCSWFADGDECVGGAGQPLQEAVSAGSSKLVAAVALH